MTNWRRRENRVLLMLGWAAAVILLFALLSHAWAGCSNFVDGSLDAPAPKATICIAGLCEKTALEYNCGNAYGAQWGYLNGLQIDIAKSGATASMNTRDISIDKITCSEIDPDACFLLPE